MVNFLALLGWSPGEGREKLTRAEMVAAFEIGAIHRKGAVFDEQKLEWLNSQYINDLEPARIAAMIQSDLEAAGLLRAELLPGGARHGWFLQVLEALKARSKLIPDFARDLRPFLGDQFEYRPDALEKHVTGPGKSGGPEMVAARLRALRAVFAAVEPFDEPHAEAALRSLAESRGEAAALYIHPLRLALVGTAVSPGVFTILVLIGLERALARLDRLAQFIERGAVEPGAVGPGGVGPGAVDTPGARR